MKFSFQRFVLIATTVMGTVSVAAEPCANGYGAYDMTACNACAKNGKGDGQCCDALYRGSLGRDDDDGDDSPTDGGCVDLGDLCDVGHGACTPGLTCTRPCLEEVILNEYQSHPKQMSRSYTCEKQPYPACVDPIDDYGASLLRDSSSSTRNDEGGDPSFVVVVVGLLGAAMMARKVVKSRHDGVALRRRQYSEVDPTSIQV